MARAWLALALLSSGCTGTLSGGRGDYDAGPIILYTDDAAAPTSRDAGAPPVGVDAGTAPPPAADAGPSDPCADVVCPEHASCSAGACRCQPGFSAEGMTCVPLPPGDPALRTEEEVCDAWRAGHVENGAWQAGTGTCDPGTLPPEAIEDTVRRVNLFRWLAGLPAVSHDGSRHDELMECAHMMSANNALSHGPPSSWSCYTAGGAAAAGRSNIALGYRTSASAVDGYMADRRVPSLGHRRWILHHRLGAVEIGFSGRGQCLGVFNSSGRSDRTWTAYPNQGFAPLALAQDTWSFHAHGISLRGTAVTVERARDRALLPVESYSPGLSGPPPSVGFTPSGWTPAAGETYRVTIEETSVGPVTYEVNLVGC
jgi:hypothetical protein